MNRHFYFSDNLRELEAVEAELEAQGITTEQIHVLSDQDADLQPRRLNPVPSLMKTDLVHAGLKGSIVGLLLAIGVLSCAYAFGWTQSFAGWAPFVFLAMILFGFSIWEAGFFGFQNSNSYFKRFQERLRQGQHLFFIDLNPEQEPLLAQVLLRHPALQAAGTGLATPHWLVRSQQSWRRLRRTL